MRLRTPTHRLALPITLYVYRHADAIVVYGEHVKRYLESEGVPAERIFVAPHAVDNASYNRTVDGAELGALRRHLDLEPDTKVILYLGRLEDGKGLPVLLEAFASLNRQDAVLVLAGSGSQRPALQALARDLGISDRVRFPGFLETASTVVYYALAWVYVLPSITTLRFKEPWGLVVNEAFNQGLPVIATDAVGAAAGGLLKDGVNGHVVPEADARALAGALKGVLDDPQRRATMSRNARAVIADWDNARMVSGFQRALDYVLRRRAGSRR
jgi:glycosyltransferase involved in cell wall biosynthesis